MKLKGHRIVAATLTILTICSTTVVPQERITFARGTSSATRTGTIDAGRKKTYVLGARYGQVLTGNVSSSGDCIKFTEGSTSMSFVTTAGSNYISLTNYCRRPVSFRMTVSINYGSD